MKRQPVRISTGKNCRSSPATFAAHRAAAAAVPPATGAPRRILLFAQFPPVALFAAMARAVSRRQKQRQIASGTRLAMTRLRPVLGGPER
jgi:hypothetical protein